MGEDPPLILKALELTLDVNLCMTVLLKPIGGDPWVAQWFGPERDPGDLGSNPTSGSWCTDPASPSACVSASLSLCDYHKIKKKIKIKIKKK